MAADYDKLFRPHEGMEAPDDMAAQPFFDPSASFPPAPASANLPKPNGQTPPPTSDTTNANRSAAATGITGAPRTLARATSTPAHRTSTALGKDANRRTPARSVQTVCVPGRTTDPACPPTLPTCAPGSPLSHRHRTKRREGSNWSIHPGAAAGRGSIRRAARPRNGALASAVGPTEIVSGSAHPPRADRTSPQPLAAAQLRSACRATRPPRFSRPTCRGAT